MKDLRALSLLAVLDEPTLRRIADAVQERRYRDRQIIFRENTQSRGLYIVKTGYVMVLRSGREKPILLQVRGAGEPLDLVTLLDGRPHSVTAQPRGPVVLYVVPLPAAQDIIRDSPALLSAIMREVNSRLRLLASQATSLALQDVNARICRVLLEQIQVRGEPGSEGVSLPRILSQSDLASLAGTSREVAWRSLHELQRRGIVRLERRHLLICKPQRLAELNRQI